MLKFLFRGVWVTQSGNTLTHLYRRIESNRKDAEYRAEEFFKWFGKKLPDTYKFIGYDLVKVEAI